MRRGPIFDGNLCVSINLLCLTVRSIVRIFTKTSVTILFILPMIRLVKDCRELGSMPTTSGVWALSLYQGEEILLSFLIELSLVHYVNVRVMGTSELALARTPIKCDCDEWVCAIHSGALLLFIIRWFLLGLTYYGHVSLGLSTWWEFFFMEWDWDCIFKTRFTLAVRDESVFLLLFAQIISIEAIHIDSLNFKEILI